MYFGESSFGSFDRFWALGIQNIRALTTAIVLQRQENSWHIRRRRKLILKTVLRNNNVGLEC